MPEKTSKVISCFPGLASKTILEIVLRYAHHGFPALIRENFSAFYFKLFRIPLHNPVIEITIVAQ